MRPEPGTEAFETTYDKILVEQTVRGEPELATTIVRLPQFYGPGDYSHRTFEYLKRMDDGRPVILLPTTWQTFVRLAAMWRMWRRLSLCASFRKRPQVECIMSGSRKILRKPSGLTVSVAPPVGKEKSFSYHMSACHRLCKTTTVTIRGRIGRSNYVSDFGRVGICRANSSRCRHATNRRVGASKPAARDRRSKV